MNSSVLFGLLVLCFGAFLTAQSQYSPIPITCPDHEIWYKCGASCQTRCATLNKPCRIRYFRCPDGCYCEKGYARLANKTCVPIEECPVA